MAAADGPGAGACRRGCGELLLLRLAKLVQRVDVLSQLAGFGARRIEIARTLRDLLLQIGNLTPQCILCRLLFRDGGGGRTGRGWPSRSGRGDLLLMRLAKPVQRVVILPQLAGFGIRRFEILRSLRGLLLKIFNLSPQCILCRQLFRDGCILCPNLLSVVLGGILGITAVLRTWDQTLLDHFHLHCLVPAGALSFDRNRWVSARQDFLFPVKALSLVFRAKFLDSLKKSFDQNKLLLLGHIAHLADAQSFNVLLKGLRKKPWVVYAKKPFGSAAHVLDYLGRYTHRVALSNDRIVSSSNGEVTFAYRDRKNQDRRKLMTLDAEEFIRRFLLHVIPKGFMRVRHYGFLANHCKDALSKCRQLIGLTPAPPPSPQRSIEELMLALTGIDIQRCPLCQNGTLVWVCELAVSLPWDSS